MYEAKGYKHFSIVNIWICPLYQSLFISKDAALDSEGVTV